MKKAPRIERPKRDKLDREIEGMLEATNRAACRPIIFNATAGDEKDFAAAEESLAAAQEEIHDKAEEARKKVSMC